MLIGRFGEAASHELADVSGVTTMSISRAVTALERKGWITCSIDDSNRRRKILRLSKEGQKLYKQMLPTADKVAKYLFDSLHPGEILAFDRYVDTLIESLEARDERGRSIFIEKTRPDA
jgi:DNA-binding MarR family transcriptional regulator